MLGRDAGALAHVAGAPVSFGAVRRIPWAARSGVLAERADLRPADASARRPTLRSTGTRL